MEKQTKYVAFSTQKGGAGKTTMTVITTSWLHYVRGYDVAVVDCDYPQYRILDMRKRDMRLATDDEHYKYMAYEQFTRLGKKAWPVIESNTKNAVADARRWIEERGREYDYVFFDLPGTMNDTDLIHTVAQMDYLIAPMAADRTVMESTLKYVVSIQRNLLDHSDIKGLYMLWNMVDGREKSELYKVYELICAELRLPVLKTFIPNSLRFRREQSEVRKEVFRSTLFPIDKSFAKASNIDALTDELIELFK